MGLAAWMTENLEHGRFESEWAIVDGARMHYLKAGSGPPLILIHGIIGSSFSWRRNLDSLAQDSTVYAVDLLGLGESDRVEGLDAGMPATAERMVRFMDAVKVDSAHVLGTSHGGAVAMLLAANHADRVRELVLVAPANPFSDVSDAIVRFYQTGLGKWFAPLVPNLPQNLQEIALGRMYGDRSRIMPGTIEHYMDALRVPGTPQHVVNILDSWFDDMRKVADCLSRLEEKRILLVWGDKDRAVILKSGYKLQERLHKAQLKVMETAGHLPYEELPGEFNRIMRGWLASSNEPLDARSKARGLHLVEKSKLEKSKVEKSNAEKRNAKEDKAEGNKARANKLNTVVV